MPPPSPSWSIRDSVTANPKLREMENPAHLLDRRLQALQARGESEFDQAFVSVEQQRIGAMVVTSDTMFSDRSAALGLAAARHAVPAMGAYRDFPRAGGLMSYGSDLGDAYRRVGLCAARILKGEAPRDLPVMQSTKVEFVINAGAAERSGCHAAHAARACRRGDRIAALLCRCDSLHSYSLGHLVTDHRHHHRRNLSSGPQSMQFWCCWARSMALRGPHYSKLSGF